MSVSVHLILGVAKGVACLLSIGQVLERGREPLAAAHALLILAAASVQLHGELGRATKAAAILAGR